MGKDSITITRFYGGMSPFEKIGVGGEANISAKLLKNLDIHEDPSYVTQNPKTTKVSGSTVLDLVKWIEDGTPHDTNRYFYDESGNIYKETSGGVWSVDRATATIGNGAAGQGLLVFDNYLYYATATTLGRLGKLSGTPAYSDDFLSDGTTNVDQSLSTSGNTYTLATSIAETATHRQTFVPTRDPLKAIIILVAAKGTGNWTVTVHDANNNSIGSATIANASVTGSTDNTFTFSTPLRLIIGNTYHFHVTSTVADGTVTTTTASDLETVDFSTLFGILVSDSNYHPMIEHLNGVVIGNERYLAFWDQATYNPNQVTLAAGYNVRTLTKINEFVVAGCWRGDSIDGVEEGRLYFWDGISSTFNYYEDVPMGLVNALASSKNRLIGVYGSRGGMYLGDAPFQKFMEIPNLARGKKVEVLPGAISNWRERVVVGFSGSTDDANFPQGVYEEGSAQDGIPEALSLGYVISSGTSTGTTLRIGSVKGIGNALYIGWDDDGTYGVDKVLKTDTAFASASYEGLRFDNGTPHKEKLAVTLLASFDALTTGQSVAVKYKKDAETGFTTVATANTVGDTKVEFNFAGVRYKEIELGFDITSSSNTNVVVKSLYFEFDNLAEEANN